MNTEPTVANFQKLVWDYFEQHQRAMPWRNPEADGTYNPYKIMVSELMLQQTQVARVEPKYKEFLRLFPDITGLAQAPLSEVLKAWSGLGYNRRAKYIWQAAQMVARDYSGIMPSSITDLVKLPGVGPNTAAAICAYAYDQPMVFIETNIRTVFIHHFFNDQTNVSDKDILKLVKQTLPAGSLGEIARESGLAGPRRDRGPHKACFVGYRRWYYALMDYGAHLKATVGNKTRQAKAYTMQSTFKGSRRQLRGAILQNLSLKPLSKAELSNKVADERTESVVGELMQEHLIHEHDGIYSLG